MYGQTGSLCLIIFLRIHFPFHQTAHQVIGLKTETEIVYIIKLMINLITMMLDKYFLEL